MGLHLLCPFSTSKLVWLMGLIFTSIVAVQYFELPCGNAVSCLFPSSKASLRYSSRNFAPGVVNLTRSNVPTIDFLDNEDRNPKDQSTFEDLSHESTGNATKLRNSSVWKDRDFDQYGMAEHVNAELKSSSVGVQDGKMASLSENFGSLKRSPPSKDLVIQPVRLTNQDASPRNMIDKNLSTTSSVFNATEVSKDAVIHQENGTFRPRQCNLGLFGRSSSMALIRAQKEMFKKGSSAVASIATMNNMILQSHSLSLPNSGLQCDSSARDQELLWARSQIQNAPTFQNSHGLYAPIYWNISRFQRSYELMEQTLKVYIYGEGKRPVFHQPNLKGIYASEGWFMKLMEASKQYITTNPSEAHLFYLPFSSQMLEQTVYVPNSHSFDRLKQYLANYLDMIKTKHSFWNRTSGADHFLVACHDWAPEETRRLMTNCIRALCNADLREGFQLGKDVSLPETNVQSVRFSPKEFGGKPPSQRQILAFFAGNMHGYVRPILLKYWENKDPDMKIFGRMDKASYIDHMKSSKYCVCARGYEVNSPRLVEAIMYGCVPVIISDNFVPPFLEVVNWEKIAVFVLEKDIPNLKNILLSISERRYLVLQKRVKMVRQHFLWHPVPQKYDIFNMILHSIWYNRVFQIAQQGL